MHENVRLCGNVGEECGREMWERQTCFFAFAVFFVVCICRHKSGQECTYARASTPLRILAILSFEAARHEATSFCARRCQGKGKDDDKRHWQ